MKNVLLAGMLNMFPELIAKIKELIPGILITANYEEVLAMVKNNENIQLCILTNGYNYSKSPTNNIQGYEAAKALHEINSKIPILILNGAQNEVSEKTGLLENISISTDNEIYVDTGEDLYHEDFISLKIFSDFFRGNYDFRSRVFSGFKD
jgi:hypothetical protein